MPRVKRSSDLTFADLDRVDPAGGNGLLTQAGKAAREFVCGLYETYPFGLLSLGNEVGKTLSGTRGMLDEMCRPIGKLPPAPIPGFSGGQCSGILYEVRVFTTRIAVIASGFRDEAEVNSDTYLGPISGASLSGIRILSSNGQFVKTFSTLTISHSAINAQGQVFPATSIKQFYADGAGAGIASINSTQITRLDGQSDSCGDPLPSYPPSLPPINKFTNTTSVNIAPNVSVVVPITIIPTLIAPVTNIFRPEFNVRVGDIDINLSPDGVRFSNPTPFPPGNNIVFDPRIVLPDPKVIQDDDTPISATDLTPVLVRLDELEDEIVECCDRNHPFAALPQSRIISTSLGSGNSGIIQLPPKTFRVVTTITSPLSVINTQAGDNSPSIYYAGWAWFEVDGGMSERYPIDAATKSFEPPARSTGRFAYKLQKDYTVSVIGHSSNK